MNLPNADAGGDQPEPAVHRGASVGNEPCEKFVTFLLDAADIEPQPVTG